MHASGYFKIPASVMLLLIFCILCGAATSEDVITQPTSLEPSSEANKLTIDAIKAMNVSIEI